MCEAGSPLVLCSMRDLKGSRNSESRSRQVGPLIEVGPSKGRGELQRMREDRKSKDSRSLKLPLYLGALRARFPVKPRMGNTFNSFVHLNAILGNLDLSSF